MHAGKGSALRGGGSLRLPIGIKIRKKGDKGTHFVDADGVESSSIHEGASR
jgi:hypothetical protein